MTKMNIEADLDKAQKLMDAIDAKMNGVSLSVEERVIVFNGLLHLSLEHYGSIIVLIGSKLNASAAALLRPQYEALIRGLYFYECATENEIQSFMKNKDPVRLSKMVEAVEVSFSSRSFGLAKFYNMLKSHMNDFTHGGFVQLKRRYTLTELTNNFSEQERKNLIMSSRVLAIVASSFAATVAGKEDIAREFISSLKE